MAKNLYFCVLIVRCLHNTEISGHSALEIYSRNCFFALQMNKLQLYITKSGNTLKSLFNLNPSEDIRRHVCDLTEAVNTIAYNADEKNIFYLISSIDEGFFFTILRTIPPMRGHHLATWIYIPGDTVISVRELEDLIRMTTRKISNTEVSNEDVAQLREAFNVEYPADKNAPGVIASQGHGYAWRAYGGESGLSLSDFLGRGLYQQSYLPYKGVLLVDADLNYEVKCDDLNDIPLGEEAVILPPEKSDEGFTAHVFGRLLDRPLRGTLGAPLTIVWKRPGFEDVVDEEVVDSHDFTPQPVATADSHKLITPKSFYITSQVTRDELRQCSIRVNGHDITAEGHSFTPDELHRAQVVINCEGHFPFTGTIDMASTTRALVQMQERRKIYRFEVPVISSDLGAPIKFEIQSKKTLSESPLEGYALLDDMQEGPTRMNHLGFIGKGISLTGKLIYVGIGLLAGILLMWICGKCSGPSESHLAPAATPAADSASAQQVTDKKAPEVTPAAAKPAAPASTSAPKQAATSLITDNNKAIKYLEDNGNWQREEMEKYALLQGLFDDMNNYRVEKIVNTWGPKLASSQAFAQVVTNVKQGANKDKAKANIAKAPFTDKNVISVYGWRCKVDP